MHDRFLTRLGKIYHFFTTEYMTKVFDEMIKEVEPEMQLHFSRWAEENDKAISFDNPTTPEGALHYCYPRLDRTRNGQPIFMKWCKNNLPQFALSNEQMVVYFGEKPPLPADAIADCVEGMKWE